MRTRRWDPSYCTIGKDSSKYRPCWHSSSDNLQRRGKFLSLSLFRSACRLRPRKLHWFVFPITLNCLQMSNNISVLNNKHMYTGALLIKNAEGVSKNSVWGFKETCHKIKSKKNNSEGYCRPHDFFTGSTGLK